MPAVAEGPTPEETGYIRAGGGVAIDGRQALRVGLALCVLALVGGGIGLAVSASDQNSNQSKLRHHGVPVEATVTECVAIAGGTGANVVNYSCRATYSLDGHTYNQVVRGVTGDLPVGSRLAAVAVPGDPSLLSAPNTVAGARSSWTPYVTPIVLGALAVVLAVGLLLWPKRRAPTPPAPPSSPPVHSPRVLRTDALMEPELREMLDREQIRDLATRYSVSIDSKDMESLLALFDPEVDNEKYGKGLEGVRAYYSRFTEGGEDGRALHFVANHQIDFVDSQHATGVVYVRAFAGADGRWMDIPALYLDEYVKRAGRWYFSIRVPAELQRMSFEQPPQLGYQPLADGWAMYRQRRTEAGGR